MRSFDGTPMDIINRGAHQESMHVKIIFLSYKSFFLSNFLSSFLLSRHYPYKDKKSS